MSTLLAQKAAQRLTTSLTVVISDGKASYVTETKNLSDTGLCLRLKEVFPVGTQLHLVFGQPPELPRLEHAKESCAGQMVERESGCSSHLSVRATIAPSSGS